jgi:hypothetical protein
VDEAHKLKKRLCAYARARDSVIMCAQHDVDVIYHASYVDDEGEYNVFLALYQHVTSAGMRLLEERKDHIFVVSAINWLWATLYEAEAFGYTTEHAEKVGYKRELEVAVAGLREMHKRGILMLPGGSVELLFLLSPKYLEKCNLTIYLAITGSPGRRMAFTPVI